MGGCAKEKVCVFSPNNHVFSLSISLSPLASLLVLIGRVNVNYYAAYNNNTDK